MAIHLFNMLEQALGFVPHRDALAAAVEQFYGQQRFKPTDLSAYSGMAAPGESLQQLSTGWCKITAWDWRICMIS
jgi:hypothetical protein